MEPLGGGSGDSVFQASIFEMILSSGPVVQSVLVVLIVLSVVSWAITISKYLQFKKAGEQSSEFQALFWESKNLARIDDSSERLHASPLSYVFRMGYRELSNLAEEYEDLGAEELGTVSQALERGRFEETVRLEKGLTFLASVASAAPFIGLFGTVWGIMNAFHGLSDAKLTTLQAVAPGISEALVATAIGLAAAIPAAVAYNYFAVALKHSRESMGQFGEEFLALARQQLARGN
jgi:biopolymer transport protein TolQ